MQFHTRLLASAAVGFALTAPLAAQEASDVVATVNGTEITLGHMILTRAGLPQQYQDLPPDVLFDGILEQLVQQQLLADALEDSPARVELALENEARSLRAGEIVNEITMGAVSDEAVQAAFEEQYGSLEPETEWNASHILVETIEEAQEIIARVEGGEEFADVARDASTGPSGPNGGQLGWFGEGVMVPSFEEAVTSMEVGGLSEPVETQFGWHIITLNETRDAEPPALEQVREQIEGGLQQAALAARLEELEAGGAVEMPEEGAFDPALLTNLDLLEP